MNSILLAITALCVGLSPIYSVPEANGNGKFLEPSELRSISFYPKTKAKEILGLEEASREYFVREGSIFRHTAAGDTCIKRGEGAVSYGEAVSRNEFGGDRGLFFPECPSTRVAFYRKDESAVRLFHLLDITRCVFSPSPSTIWYATRETIFTRNSPTGSSGNYDGAELSRNRVQEKNKQYEEISMSDIGDNRHNCKCFLHCRGQ